MITACQADDSLGSFGEYATDGVDVSHFCREDVLLRVVEPGVDQSELGFLGVLARVESQSGYSGSHVDIFEVVVERFRGD